MRQLLQKACVSSFLIVLALSPSNSVRSSPLNAHSSRRLLPRVVYSWTTALNELLSPEKAIEPDDYADYGIFIDRSKDTKEINAFVSALRENLEDDDKGGPGRFSFVSTYPFDRQDKADFVSVRLGKGLAQGMKGISVVKDVLVNLKLGNAQSLKYYTEPMPDVVDPAVEEEAKTERQMLNQAPGRPLADVAQNPESSKGEGSTIFLVDTGAYADDPRVKAWIYPGEQEQTKGLVGYNGADYDQTHGSIVLDVLMDPEGGASAADVVVVRALPSGNIDTLLDIYHQMAAYVIKNDIPSTSIANWCVGWDFREGTDEAWKGILDERFAALTELGTIPVVAAGNDVRNPFEISTIVGDLDTKSKSPIIYVGNVGSNGKTAASSQGADLVTTNAMGQNVNTRSGGIVRGTSIATPQVSRTIAKWISPKSPWRANLLRLHATRMTSKGLADSPSKYSLWAGVLRNFVSLKSYPRTQINPANYAPILYEGYDSQDPKQSTFGFFPGGSNKDSWQKQQASPQAIARAKQLDRASRELVMEAQQWQDEREAQALNLGGGSTSGGKPLSTSGQTTDGGTTNAGKKTDVLGQIIGQEEHGSGGGGGGTSSPPPVLPPPIEEPAVHVGNPIGRPVTGRPRPPRSRRARSSRGWLSDVGVEHFWTAKWLPILN